MNDPAIVLQPKLATRERCKDTKDLKERLKAWSLEVTMYEHQFKAIDGAQKTPVVRGMMPKTIKREFLTERKWRPSSMKYSPIMDQYQCN